MAGSQRLASKPLTGLTVLEFAGIGPGPFCGMLLSDMGADVICIRRPDAAAPGPLDFEQRGRRNLTLDLKQPDAVATCLDLCTEVDILIEGYRPGVMERLGLGPEHAFARNAQLVYGRITGWGQEGPYSLHAGHDLNYSAISGAIAAIGPADAPAVPLNLIADYGGGAMFLAFGVLAGVFHARNTGEGQVVDAAMSDGASYLMTAMYMMRAQGRWQDRRFANLLDGAAPFYRCYRCADGRWIAIAPIEDRFFAVLAERLEIPEELAKRRNDPASWDELGAFFEDIFQNQPSIHWQALLEGTDACFTPVMDMAAAPHHPHHIARDSFRFIDGAPCPNPAPRFFSRSSYIAPHRSGAESGQPGQ